MNLRLIIQEIMILVLISTVSADELTSITFYRVLPYSFVQYQKEIFRTFFFWLTDTTLLMNIAVIIANIVFVLILIKSFVSISK